MADLHRRLTALQRRHLIELYGDGSIHTWHPVGPEHHTAGALARRGLVREHRSSRRGYAVYALTLAGRVVAHDLIRGVRALVRDA